MSEDRKSAGGEVELFRRSVGPVVPLRSPATAELRRRRPRPVPRQAEADERAVLVEMIQGDIDPAELETGDELLYKGPGLQDRQFRKLRRGQFVVEGELDLHGLTAEAAHQAVNEFITSARNAGRRCVRIIHGKGRGSRHGRPVIKTRLQRWLRQRKDVLAFCSARPVDGGTGAAYVLIRR